MDNEQEQQIENPGETIVKLIWNGLLIVFLIAVLILGLYLVSDGVRAGIHEIVGIDPTPTPLSDSVSFECPEPQPCPEPETIVIECPEFVCPGCPVCPTLWEVTDSDAEEMEAYFLFADQFITELESIGSLMSLLNHLVQDNGSSQSQKMQMTNDPQWRDLYSIMNTRTDLVIREILVHWPPRPYDSSNPLMYAHTRLLMATLHLDSAREDFRSAIVNDKAYYMDSHRTDIENMLTHIDNAQIGIQSAR